MGIWELPALRSRWRKTASRLNELTALSKTGGEVNGRQVYWAQPNYERGGHFTCRRERHEGNRGHFEGRDNTLNILVTLHWIFIQQLAVKYVVIQLMCQQMLEWIPFSALNSRSYRQGALPTFLNSTTSLGSRCGQSMLRSSRLLCLYLRWLQLVTESHLLEPLYASDASNT